MFKELLFKIEFYYDQIIGLFLSLFLIFNGTIIAKNINLDDGVLNQKFLLSTTVILFALILAYYSLNAYLKEKSLYHDSVRIKDYNEAFKMLKDTECTVGKINKFLTLDTKAPFYDVYFKYKIRSENGKLVDRVSHIKVILEDKFMRGEEILLSSNFKFIQKDLEIGIECLDRLNCIRMYTWVIVECQGEAKLHEGSKHGFEFIPRTIKSLDEIYR